MTYYARELYQKQHHRQSWRKRHSFELHSAKNGGGISVYATSGEAKREGVSRLHASLRGIQRRLSAQKVSVPTAVHIWAGRRSVTGHWILLAEKTVPNTRLSSVSGSAFLRNWKLSKRSGRMIGVDQSTACRTITRVTDALMLRVRDWIKMPTQAEANRQKQMFYAMRVVPSVIGCIDGTHIHMQGPNQQEHEFVNRKNYHSINIQVILLHNTICVQSWFHTPLK